MYFSVDQRMMILYVSEGNDRSGLSLELCTVIYMYTMSQKNDNDVAHYNFNAH